MTEATIEPRREVVVYDRMPDRFCAVITLGGVQYLAMNPAGLDRLRKDINDPDAFAETFDVFTLTAIDASAKAGILRKQIEIKIAERRQ